MTVLCMCCTCAVTVLYICCAVNVTVLVMILPTRRRNPDLQGGACGRPRQHAYPGQLRHAAVCHVTLPPPKYMLGTPYACLVPPVHHTRPLLRAPNTTFCEGCAGQVNPTRRNRRRSPTHACLVQPYACMLGTPASARCRQLHLSAAGASGSFFG